jgi:hypothetical protein
MTSQLYGSEAPDYGSDADLTIRPANAHDLDYTPVAPAATAPAGGAPSLFDELLSLANEEVSNPVSFPVTSRKGYVLDFNAVIGEHEIKRYRNASMGKKKRPEDADMVLGNALPMIDKCTGIFKVVDGVKKQVLDNDGDPLLLNSTEFVTAFGRGGTAHAAVAKFLGDAETVTIGGALLKAAGWGEDLEPLDPIDA